MKENDNKTVDDIKKALEKMFEERSYIAILH